MSIKRSAERPEHRPNDTKAPDEAPADIGRKQVGHAYEYWQLQCAGCGLRDTPP
jgi:hypothetical protein